MVPRAGLTPDRLTAAAADLADEIGFENVTLAALAKHFGVKDASLYSHVRNLQDLRTRVALLAGGEMIDRIAAAVAGRAGKDALAVFAGAYRAYALERPGRYAATQIRIDQSLIADTPVFHRTAEITYGMLRAYGLDRTRSHRRRTPVARHLPRLLRPGVRGRLRRTPRRTDVLGPRGRRPAHTLENWPRREEHP